MSFKTQTLPRGIRRLTALMACLAMLAPLTACSRQSELRQWLRLPARMSAAKTVTTVPVHDLIKEPTVPPQYGDFLFSTFDVDRSNISADDGFTFAHGKWTPNRKGAVLTIRHVGKWNDNTGAEQWINAKFTVNDWRRAYFEIYYDTTGKALDIFADNRGEGATKRAFMDVTIDFLLDDGSKPKGFRGVTGFEDLDGVESMPDNATEGWELLSGFDGVWKRADAHLKAFGTNGWAGYLDDSPNDKNNPHRKYHYMAVTFTGSTLRARYSVNNRRWELGSYFNPIPATAAFKLNYDANGGTGTPNQTN